MVDIGPEVITKVTVDITFLAVMFLAVYCFGWAVSGWHDGK